MSADLPLGTLSRTPSAPRASSSGGERLQASRASSSRGLDRRAAARRQAGRRDHGAGVDGGVGARFKRVDPNTSPRSTSRCSPAAASPPATAPARRASPSSTRRWRGGWRSGSASPTRRGSIGRTVRLADPLYENRGQSGKAGGRRDRRRDPQRARHGPRGADAGSGLRRACPGAAARNQADRADPERAGGGDAGDSRRGAAARSAPAPRRRADDGSR